VIGNAITRGFGPLADELARMASTAPHAAAVPGRPGWAASPPIVALDGPAAIDWPGFVAQLGAELGRRNVAHRLIDARARLTEFAEVVRKTESAELREDPVFARTFGGRLSDLLAPGAARIQPVDGVLTIAFGTGSALACDGAVIWYVDLPKRLALRAVDEGRAANLGQPDGAAGSARRLLFVDWPVEDRHRRALAGRWSRYVDASDPAAPRSVDGDSLRESLRAVAAGPFRTRPAFLPVPWGGRWARDVLGANDPGPNAGLGYELIAPESGVLLGDAPPLEVALDVMLVYEPAGILGSRVIDKFGIAFPIRFDYLDTVGGGDLSVHCHPRPEYMRSVFGVPITQHETYYVMVTRPGGRIFLGLRDDADAERFRAAATQSASDRTHLDIERFVNTVAAHAHELYLIPAGTPHGSGEGNVVLEISATPYLYSLRFYDWLRKGLAGEPRAVQLDHAFANLALDRRGDEVRSLVAGTAVVRSGDGFRELAFGTHPELFFAVHRLEFETAIEDSTDGRFAVLNLAEGESVSIRTASGREHTLSYAETIVIPASVGRYEIRTARVPAKVIKAFVS
jgi:mannose-6-phosphate isomerase class I